jgi:hypothetical protein
MKTSSNTEIYLCNILQDYGSVDFVNDFPRHGKWASCSDNNETSSSCRWRWLPNMDKNCKCIKWALEVSGDIKIGGQVICTMKYGDDLVLLAKEAAVLQGKTDKLNEIGKCYGMEMNVEKYSGNVNLNKMNIEIAERIVKGNKAYCANAKLIKLKFLKRSTKMKIFKAIIRPVVTY